MKRIFILFFAISVFLSLVLSSCTVPNADEDLAPQIPDESEIYSESVFDGEGDDKQETQDVHENKEEIQCGNQQIIEEDETDETESDESKQIIEYSNPGYHPVGEGTFEYKGITFEGWYGPIKKHGRLEYQNFHVNINTLYSGEGYGLLRASYTAVLAYIAGDVDKYMKVSDLEEIWRERLKMSGDWKENRIHYLDLLVIDSIIITTSEDTFGMYYKPTFSDRENNHYICVSVYLNDKGEWKVSHMSYC